jgi:8-oxo-dGTP pyrophosphatase MutT (NUDIX family)
MIAIGYKNYEQTETFISNLQERLKHKLPGEDAQLLMASAIRMKELGYSNRTTSAIRSGVLILLYPDKGKLCTVFILRQTYDGVHSGQISFPGGRFEENDSNLIETALREANEEVNIVKDRVKLLGTLSELYIPPSNFLVLPVVGFSASRPDFIPDKSEVAEIIETDISFLFDNNLLKKKIIDIKGYKIEAPFFDVFGHVVWGATAMILSEFKMVIESID